MKLPENYDPSLSKIIDAHTSESIVPGRYVVRYLDISADFARFFKEQKIKPKHVLDLGGRSLPYLEGMAPKSVMIHEPRSSYFVVAKKLHGQVQLSATGGDVDIKDIDLVLVNFELGGLEGNEILADFNRHFEKNLPVYGYRYNTPYVPEVGVGFLDDGTVYDASAQKKWHKKITNHMHMGVPQHSYDYVTFYDLCRSY